MEAVRTCIGCRSRVSRSSLLRVVAHGSQLYVDSTATAPGRGAWIHPTRDCFDKATSRRAFGRALRVDKALDASALEAVVSGAETNEKAERHSELK